MRQFVAVMISCEKREELRRNTLLAFRVSGVYEDSNAGEWIPMRVVLDTEACDGKDVRRPQDRQERVSLLALQLGVTSGADYILFLEDDLTFNDHLFHNLQNWAPIVQECLDLGSLYNPSVVGPNEDSQHFDNTRIADPNKVYGSQAFVLSRRLAQYCVDNWWSVPGMQDIKISRLAATMPKAYSICYHSPSLVQHVGSQSAWTEDNRFHQAGDFDKEWRA